MVVKTANLQAGVAQAATVLLSVPAGSKVQIRAIHLSVPDTQSASIAVGSTYSFPTNGSLNLDFTNGRIRGGDGEDITVTSSGAVSAFVTYDLVDL